MKLFPTYLIAIRCAARDASTDFRVKVLATARDDRSMFEDFMDGLERYKGGLNHKEKAAHAKSAAATDIVLRAWSEGPLPDSDECEILGDLIGFHFSSTIESIYRSLSDLDRSRFKHLFLEATIPADAEDGRQRVLEDLAFEDESIRALEDLNQSFVDGTFVADGD